MRDLKFKASQPLPDLKLTLKKLKSKQLIKTINDIDNKTRQIHILFELVPHPDCTGGAWYSESEVMSTATCVGRDREQRDHGRE
jgi:hypothetical protein